MTQKRRKYFWFYIILQLVQIGVSAGLLFLTLCAFTSFINVFKNGSANILGVLFDYENFAKYYDSITASGYIFGDFSWACYMISGLFLFINVTCFLVFLFPKTRSRLLTINWLNIVFGFPFGSLASLFFLANNRAHNDEKVFLRKQHHAAIGITFTSFFYLLVLSVYLIVILSNTFIFKFYLGNNFVIFYVDKLFSITTFTKVFATIIGSVDSNFLTLTIGNKIIPFSYFFIFALAILAFLSFIFMCFSYKKLHACFKIFCTLTIILAIITFSWFILIPYLIILHEYHYHHYVPEGETIVVDAQKHGYTIDEEEQMATPAEEGDPIDEYEDDNLQDQEMIRDINTQHGNVHDSAHQQSSAHQQQRVVRPTPDYDNQHNILVSAVSDTDADSLPEPIINSEDEGIEETPIPYDDGFVPPIGSDLTTPKSYENDPDVSLPPKYKKTMSKPLDLSIKDENEIPHPAISPTSSREGKYIPTESQKKQVVEPIPRTVTGSKQTAVAPVQRTITGTKQSNQAPRVVTGTKKSFNSSHDVVKVKPIVLESLGYSKKANVSQPAPAAPAVKKVKTTSAKKTPVVQTTTPKKAKPTPVKASAPANPKKLTIVRTPRPSNNAKHYLFVSTNNKKIDMWTLAASNNLTSGIFDDSSTLLLIVIGAATVIIILLLIYIFYVEKIAKRLYDLEKITTPDGKIIYKLDKKTINPKKLTSRIKGIYKNNGLLRFGDKILLASKEEKYMVSEIDLMNVGLGYNDIKLILGRDPILLSPQEKPKPKIKTKEPKPYYHMNNKFKV